MMPAEVLRRVALKNPAYRKIAARFNGEGLRLPLPCIHEGKPVRPPDGASPCKTYLVCDAGKGVVGRCTCNDGCDLYDDGEEKLPETVGLRHVVCHVLPVSGNGVWQRTVDQLRLRWPLFTGRKIFAISTGEAKMPLDAPDRVREYLPADAETILVPNNPTIREVASWAPLWESLLASASPHDRALYCHTKGATRPVDPGNSCHWWSSLSWSLALDHWELIEKKLLRRPICGPFRKLGYGFGAVFGRWHYSGTFYWVNVGDFSTRWPAIPVPQQWWGTEAWPGLAYDIAEAEWLFLDGQTANLDLYRPSFWIEHVRPKYSSWLRENPPSWPWIAERVLAAGG